MKKIYIKSIGNINVAYAQKDGSFKYVSEDVKEGQILYYSSIEKTVKTGVQIGTSVSYKYTIYVYNMTGGRFIIPMDIVDLGKSLLQADGKPTINTGGNTGTGTGTGTGSGTGGTGQGGTGLGFGLGLGNIPPYILLIALYVILK